MVEQISLETDMKSSRKAETDDEITQRILSNRRAFKWLPVYCENDLVHGSWWYVWGSVLTIFIPVFPLVSLYAGWWPEPKDSDGNKYLVS